MGWSTHDRRNASTRESGTNSLTLPALLPSQGSNAAPSSRARSAVKSLQRTVLDGPAALARAIDLVLVRRLVIAGFVCVLIAWSAVLIAAQMSPSWAMSVGLREPAQYVPRAAKPDPGPRGTFPQSVWAHVGANAIGTNPKDAPAQSLPDWGSVGAHCLPNDPYRSDYCNSLGQANPSQPAERTIYALGNSHTILASAALLEAVGREPTWALRTQAWPGCRFDLVDSPANGCQELWETGTKYILEQQPDLVLVIGTKSHADGTEDLLPGFAEWVKMIESKTTTEVVALRDSPRFSTNMATCVKEHPQDEAACAMPNLSGKIDQHVAEVEKAGATWVDLSNLICPKGLCSPSQGGISVYMDDNHMTASYWRTLAKPLAEAIHEDHTWWPLNPYNGTYVDRTSEPAPPIVV